MNFKPEAIIKTMPMEWVSSLPDGIEGWEKDFMRMNKDEDYYWMFSLSGKPKYEILYFYLLFNGAIRYRANIFKYIGERTITCYSGEEYHGKAWVCISAPVIKAKEPIPMKGFQGFRYSEVLF